MLIKIDRLLPSPLNPRGPVVEDDELRDLATSLKSHGLLQGLTVRPQGHLQAGEKSRRIDKYEVVCGHRRLAAARLAGLAEVECKVVTIGDAEALEIMLVENSARRDVPPLQEAAALRQLIGMGGDPAALAERLGRSRKWVRDRLALSSLVEAFRDRLEQGFIGLGSAVAMALLPEATQMRLVERFKYNQTISHREVVATILAEGCRLERAPWGMNDEISDLVECACCPSRSDRQPDLWGATGDAKCLNATCWDAKREAWLEQIKARGGMVVEGYPPANEETVELSELVDEGEAGETRLAAAGGRERTFRELLHDVPLTVYVTPHAIFQRAEAASVAAGLRALGMTDAAEDIDNKLALRRSVKRMQEEQPAKKESYPVQKDIDAAMAALVDKIEMVPADDLPLAELVRMAWTSLWSETAKSILRRRKSDSIDTLISAADGGDYAAATIVARKRRHLQGLLVEIVTSREAAGLRSGYKADEWLALLKAFGVRRPQPKAAS